jgi:hypothetical protein
MDLVETSVAAERLSRSIDIKIAEQRDFYRWLFPKEDKE